jgi:tetratricopeptide (TPR) repeat protein
MGEYRPEYGADQTGGLLRRITRRWVLVSAASIFMLAVGVWVVYNIASREDRKKESALDAAIKAADSAFQAGDYQKSLEELEKVAGETQSDEEKVELYSNLAASSASAGRLDEAVDYMEKKHALAPEAAKSDAYLLGTYHERLGDNAVAIKQYKIALSYYRSLPKSSTNETRINNLEARINSLGG